MAITHPFNGPLSGTTWVSRYQIGIKPIWISLEQETVSGSGISWAICKFAPRSSQITTPVPHRSVFFTGRMPFLPPNQQRQSTEGYASEISEYLAKLRARTWLSRALSSSLSSVLARRALHETTAMLPVQLADERIVIVLLIAGRTSRFPLCRRCAAARR